MSSRTTRSTRSTRSSVASETLSPAVTLTKTTRSRKTAESKTTTTKTTTTKPAANRSRRAKKVVYDESEDEQNSDDDANSVSFDQASSVSSTPLAQLSASKQNTDHGASPLSPTTQHVDRLRRLTLQSPIADSDIANRENIRESTLTPKQLQTPIIKPEPLDDVSPSRQNVSVVGLDPAYPKMKASTEEAVKEPTPVPEGPKQRLVITNLVLNNFKSYAGRQEVGPFHSSFSAVVGPNGSGKSNVIDSLLFVFGFRANKMRQAKLSALIHNSAVHPDLTQCSVEVHFQDVIDNPDGTTSFVPDSRLVVARRAFKNNSSKYTINDRESNYGEVTTLLRERGIDLDHKRFLILQGEVESIAQMKPKAMNDSDDGLLEYLEDIIGTSKYKKLIDESAVEVEALNEACHEKLGRLEIVQKEKSKLEDARKAAMSYINDNNELVQKQNALYQLYITTSQQNVTVTEELLAELKAQLEEQLASNKGNQDEVKSLNDSYKEAIEELETFRAQAKATAKAHAKHERDVVQLTERKKHIAAKQEKLSKLIASAKLSVNSSAGWMSNYDEEIERLSSEIEQLQNNLQGEESKLEEIKESLEGSTRGISDEIEQKKKLLEPWNEKMNMKISELDVAKSELQIFIDRRAANESAIADQEARIKEIKVNGRAKEQEIENLKVELAHVNEQIVLGEDECAQASSALDEMRQQVSIARQRVQEAREQMAASESQGNVLSSLKRLEESGRISGFYGRLGNLGAIDERFDVAISTACPSLNNLVVESVETGQACIEYLRKNNLGRGMFILLDRLAQRDLSPIQTPENAPRLFDLVRPKDPKYAQAFYSVLHDTLVAKDMAQANRIAFGKKRWRVVTIDGKLIDTSGTMSGGGSRVSKGLMKSKLSDGISEKEFKKIETELAKAEQRFQEEQAKVNVMEDALSELKKRKPKLEVSISKIELEIQAMGTHLLDAKKMLAELKSELDSSSADDAAVKKLEKKISGLEAEAEQIRSKTSSIEDEIKGLEEQIMQIGGVKLRIQKSKVDGIMQQIEIRNEQISNSEMAKAKAGKESSKQNKAVATAEKELAEVEIESKAVEEELAGVQMQADEVEKVANEAAFTLEEMQENVKAIKQRVDERTKEINDFRKVEIDLENRIEVHEKEIRENRARLKHWSEKLASLVLQDTGDEDEMQTELPTYSEDELQGMDNDELKAEIALLEEKTDKAHVDLAVIEEYRRREKEFGTRNADLTAAVAQRDAMKQRYEDLRKRRLDEFMAGFSQISVKLKEMYQMITMGGNAELELVDSLDPFSEGILFSVMPPKKSWKNISNLSGGEKTLSSLALVFALHHFKPTPLYVMDEIDAALDFRNVSIVANYIKERTKNAQFIVISLRNNMFELAQQLVGIYKVNHMTKSITLKNQELTTIVRDRRVTEEQQRRQLQT
ncbi:RecF/RecN/SMC [Myxozyma melibiosi]|uniref:Structural maintenance of chromosomes protein n=1 Tax=Myxozyma melibiosi TaxID=54550 RepID=A0ABR1FAE8_9ASCO